MVIPLQGPWMTKSIVQTADATLNTANHDARPPDRRRIAIRTDLWFIVAGHDGPRV